MREAYRRNGRKNKVLWNFRSEIVRCIVFALLNNRKWCVKFCSYTPLSRFKRDRDRWREFDEICKRRKRKHSCFNRCQLFHSHLDFEAHEMFRLRIVYRFARWRWKKNNSSLDVLPCDLNMKLVVSFSWSKTTENGRIILVEAPAMQRTIVNWWYQWP